MKVPNLVSFLRHCSSLEHIRQAHGFMVPAGLLNDNVIFAQFIEACSSLGYSSYAYLVFTHKRPKPNVYLYNTMINVLSPMEAISLYNNIFFAGLRPDTYSVPYVLKAVIRLSAVEVGRQIHCQAIGTGLDSNVNVVTSLVRMYSFCGCILDARKVFDGMNVRDVALSNAMVAGYVKMGDVDSAWKVFEEMPERDLISWTSVIAGYAQMKRPKEAVMVFRRMQVENLEPDEVTVLAVLSACAHLGSAELGARIHNYMQKLGFSRKLHLNNALIDMYAKSGSIRKALDVFRSMKERSVITWTTMISGLALHGLGREASEMFSQMESALVKPNEITFIAILSACSHAGLVEMGRWYFNNMALQHGIQPKVEHYGCMIDLLGRAGYLQEAWELVRGMPFEANAAIWGSLLAASNIHGDTDLGEHALQQLMMLEPHNSGNYTLLSNIYAAFGGWDESGMVRKFMRDTGVKKMPGGSFIEVNNRVHQFNAGDTSHSEFYGIFEVLREIFNQLKMVGHLQKERIELLDFDE
ncbi:Tetratricopeptide-like helical domain containing protein [Parasponia andersonii]|uniref:Tetratricopeptide-like helical domain containing protein n=1 Tax=Parasponia andersonii TaxID=3476 RepID=A0A2P5CSE6_PARAD|nr:Tetratricopeptide-like helical domain containing protein [Parasponia andersonii]